MLDKTLEVIDFSSYLILTDPQKVAEQGVKVAYHRQGYGRYWADAAYPYVHQVLGEVGIDVPPYIMFQPTQPVDPQLDYAIAAIRETEYPTVVDVEKRHRIGRNAAGGHLWRFVTGLKKRTGRYPMIYTAPYIFNAFYWNKKYRWSEFPLWVADPDDQEKPDLPYAWKVWELWQWTWKMQIDGIKGRVDVNRYPGTLEDFRNVGKATDYADAVHRANDQREARRIRDKNDQASGNL